MAGHYCPVAHPCWITRRDARLAQRTDNGQKLVEQFGANLSAHTFSRYVRAIDSKRQLVAAPHSHSRMIFPRLRVCRAVGADRYTERQKNLFAFYRLFKQSFVIKAKSTFVKSLVRNKCLNKHAPLRIFVVIFVVFFVLAEPLFYLFVVFVIVVLVPIVVIVVCLVVVNVI